MNKEKVLTRFAPSPTGKLHIGNIRSAILNWAYAKKNNGKFILRIDDTDTERSKEEFIVLIKEDLEWLDIKFTSTFKQSERILIYEKMISKLKKDNRLYPCFETAEELSLKRKSLLLSGKPPIYDRSALNLSEKQIDEFISQGRKPHWRFLIENKKIYWNDLIRGEVNFDSTNLSDPILIREDNSLLYHLPSVVDDINEGITDIIRGEDHVNNTAFHLQLFESLGSHPPNFGHHPLLTDLQGKGLGKRLGSISVQDIKNEGFEAITIINYLLTIGTSKNISSEINIQNLIKNFEIRDLARSSPKFNKTNLININADIIKKYDFNIANGKLKEIGIINANNSFWNFIKNNISFIKESIEWWNIVSKKIVFYENDKEFLSMCASVLPDEPYSSNSWEEWLDNIKKISSRKGKELFKPLRLALTGKENGPELKYLIPLLTRKIILHRLNDKS